MALARTWRKGVQFPRVRLNYGRIWQCVPLTNLPGTGKMLPKPEGTDRGVYHETAPTCPVREGQHTPKSLLHVLLG